MDLEKSSNAELEELLKQLAPAPGHFHKQMLKAAKAKRLVIREMRRRQYTWKQMAHIGGTTAAHLKQANRAERRSKQRVETRSKAVKLLREGEANDSTEEE